MKNRLKSAVVSLLLASLGIVSLPSQAVAAEEWVEINVIVNVVDGSDSSKLGEMIKKANEILKQARIKLTVSVTNNNVNISNGNGDSAMTEAEGNDAVKDGQKELKNTFKNKKGDWTGKGIKIYLADDSWVEDPSNVGWAVHRKPVVVVEANADPNEMASTLAHELIHVLTVTDHSDDPNNIMLAVTGGGTDIDPNQIIEITPDAKKRGKVYTINPPAMPGKSIKPPVAGRTRSADRYGATLDDLNDHTSSSPSFSPFQFEFSFADLREVTIFADEPEDVTVEATMEISFEGIIPNTNPGIVQITTSFSSTPDMAQLIGELRINGNVQNPGTWQAEWESFIPPNPPVVLPNPFLHTNDRFDSPVTLPSSFHSIEQPIPVDITGLDLTSPDPLFIVVESLFSVPVILPNPIQDQTPPFTFELTPNLPVEPLLTFMRGDAQPGGNAADVLVLGCGFTPHRQVDVILNGATLQTGTADGNGLVVSNIGSSGISIGLNEVELRGTTGPFLSGFSFFSYCDTLGNFSTDLDGDGVLDVSWNCELLCPSADQDDDCDVDFGDFSIFSLQWLDGVPPLS